MRCLRHFLCLMASMSGLLNADMYLRKSCKDVGFFNSERWAFFVNAEPGFKTAFTKTAVLIHQTRPDLVTSKTVCDSMGVCTTSYVIAPTNCLVDYPLALDNPSSGLARVYVDFQWYDRLKNLHQEGYRISFFMELPDPKNLLAFRIHRVEAFAICRTQKTCDRLANEISVK